MKHQQLKSTLHRLIREALNDRRSSHHCFREQANEEEEADFSQLERDLLDEAGRVESLLSTARQKMSGLVDRIKSNESNLSETFMGSLEYDFADTWDAYNGQGEWAEDLD